MSDKPTHDICIAENFEANGEQKTHFTAVGSAWLKETGNVSCQMRDGIALTGRFILVKKKEN